MNVNIDVAMATERLLSCLQHLQFFKKVFNIFVALFYQLY